MLFIWLYLLKIATITRGHFTIPEILLTVVIGICCVYGIILSLARLSISRLANIAFIVWHMVIGFILIFFFNTLSHALPSYRRNLQKAYVENIIASLRPRTANTGNDALSIVKWHARMLEAELKKAATLYPEGITRDHFVDLAERLERALKPGDHS